MTDVIIGFVFGLIFGAFIGIALVALVSINRVEEDQ